MDEKIAQFASVAGVSADRSKFFVEAANGDIDAALSTFYESGGAEGTDSGANAEVEVEAGAHWLRRTPVGYTGPRTLSGAPAEPISASWGQADAATTSGRASSSASSRPTGRLGGIATLSSMRDEEGGTRARGGGGGFRGGIGRIHQPEDDEDDDSPPNLFAGGERSGLSVQDPEAERRRRLLQAMAASQAQSEDGGMDIVNNILRQAAEAGPPPPAAGGRGPARGQASGNIHAFGGRGRTIGDDGDSAPTLAVRNGSDRSRLGVSGAYGGTGAVEEGEEGVEDGSNLPPAVRHVTFWQDGFTIGESHLYNYDDPENQRILAALQAQRAPLSLLDVKPNQEVELRVEKKTDQKYTPPPPPAMKAFSGTGNRLSSPVPSVATAGPSRSPAGAPIGSTAPPASQVQCEVDSSKPTTQLQLRLADGSRIVGRFNHEHTIRDVRSYINAANAGMETRPYVLQTSFPPKPIEDESATLKDAGLLNAVVIQKWA
ncbi:SEP-domain-containing protein [Tilletiaria anomala UBC 951]|uniref:SEP-domain-containing protein n=1 Tax=Tilletiaria anomala (strain ATCC 24038 / CBS 436.72 / UBC 951) TaxID=1037660 RepID=A0A066VVL9_TILAU|nr:SEP-domain-containing protein [Tilletiaria anomala UBC 951]KDN42610.1 SEP-domain-containing protein [Tilletiaria anomala UBC 951]